MTNIAAALQRQSKHLILRATFIVALSFLAVALPDHFFINALLGVSALSIVHGAYEISMRGARETGVPRYDLLPILSGTSSVCFGLVSFGLIFADFNTALSMTAGWFLFYALGLGVTAGLLTSHSLARLVLASLATVHVAIGAVVFLMPMHPRISSLAIPIVGTFYAGCFGVWQGVAGAWLRQLSMHPTGGMNHRALLDEVPEAPEADRFANSRAVIEAND